MKRLLPLFVLIALCCGPTAAADEDLAFFREKIEPLLVTRCYSCHAHESGEISSGLALDWRSGWAKGGERGPAVIPREPDQSLLIRAVRHADAELQMPPEKLPEAEIALLVEWVQRGAPDPREAEPVAEADGSPDWWSLKPLQLPAVPAAAVPHPIDSFIQARLDENGLQFSPEADRRTLMRRLTYDLHGLPPTPEEVAAFVQDGDSQAYEHLVDRLLGSPRYGERWARHWFDTIHFADTHGCEHDLLRPHAWRYRDYVIESLNRDTAWPRFIREQLAADVFFPEEPRLTVALGFLGAGPYDQSAAGTAPRSYEYLDRDDLVTQTMGAFASTTVHCARCHAHKFDPIPQEDYFALQAVFAGIGKGDVGYDEDSSVAKQRQAWQVLKEAAERKDTEVLQSPDQQALVAEWEAGWGKKPVWQPVEVDVFSSQDGATLRRQPDGSILSSGPRPDKDTVTVVGTTSLAELSSVKLDLLTDESLPMHGPGRMDNGNLHLSEFELQVFRPGCEQPETLAFSQASADFDQEGWTSAHAIDRKLETAWGIHPNVGQPHHAVFQLDGRVKLETGAKLLFALKQLHGGGHLLGRFRLSLSAADAAETVAVPAELETVLALTPAQRTPEQQLALASWVLARHAESRLAQLPPQSKVYAAASRAENERGTIRYAEPRVIQLLERGDLNQPRQEVPPGALTAVSGLTSRFPLTDSRNEGTRRAALADWLTHHENPLTWRSIANRVWHYHFGRGLCDTPNDFGRMGGIPSHPELLDWLACELRDEGGSLKHLHRLICTSRAYRQSSAHQEQATGVDPDNRLLWRMNCRRLDADSYRDSVLAISGQLDLTMGGPGVQQFELRPGPQLSPALDYGSFDWNSPAASRRTVYRVVWRGISDPFMEALDFPDAALLAPARGFSASAPQALALWNNRFVLHHSRQLARRAESFATSSAEQVRAAVQLSLQREPTPAEADAFQSLAEQHGLAAVCRLLVNSNEFLFVE